jgi:replicative DNA helicase
VTDLEVPFDRWAEEAVIGCCVDSARGYRLATSRLSAADFYHPKHRRIFLACADAGHLDDPTYETLDARIALVANAACVDECEVRRLVDDRPVRRDKSGGFARRVLQRSQERHLMAVSRDVYNSLGSGDQFGALAALRVLLETGRLVSAGEAT